MLAFFVSVALGDDHVNKLGVSIKILKDMAYYLDDYWFWACY